MDFDIQNLPKNALVYRSISNNMINSNTLTTNLYPNYKNQKRQIVAENKGLKR